MLFLVPSNKNFVSILFEKQYARIYQIAFELETMKNI